MKKKWWEYCGSTGPAFIMIGFIFFNSPSASCIFFVATGIIGTATYFFMKQGQHPDDSN